MNATVFSRLGLKSGLAIVIVQASGLAFLGYEYTRRFSAEVDRSLVARAQKPAVLMSERALKPEAVKQAGAMRELVGPGLEQMLVTDTNGQVLHATDRQWVGKSVTNVPSWEAAWLAEARAGAVWRQVSEDGQMVLLSLSPVTTGAGSTPSFLVWVRLRATEAVREKARIARLFTLGSLAAVAATSVALALCFHGLIGVRLRRVVQAVERIASGDLAVRLSGSPGGDELDQLYRGVDAMAERLQRTVATMEETVAGLRRSEGQLREQARLATLAAAVGTALTGRHLLAGMLQECAAILVRHLGAALARIWTLNEATQTLELQASAGLYTHRDGRHSLVKVGELKIGRIAQTGQPHLTNDVQHDPFISDPAWARREGIVAFAGYPLLLEGRVLGVAALFARAPLSEFSLQALGTVADQIALGIERKRADSEREKLNRELEHKNRELESLLYAASHDLRSPLVNIQGFSRRLERTLAMLSARLQQVPAGEAVRGEFAAIEAEVAKSLRFILASVTKMNLQLHALLRLSRVGRMDLHLQVTDTERMVQSLLQAMSFQVQAAGATVEVGPLPPCRADEAQLNQVFANLLDNALKYRDPARPLHLRVSGRVAGREVVYCVEDTGCGIAPAHLEKIWELFHRLDPAGPVPGEGLGLTLVRRIVERHHGRAWAESEPGRGSRFFVSLPAAG